MQAGVHDGTSHLRTTLTTNVYLLVKLAYNPNHKKYIKQGFIYMYILGQNDF